MNISKINALLALFEKASSLTVDDSPIISDWWTGGNIRNFSEGDILVEISWEIEGLIYECHISAQRLSDSIIKNGIITCKNFDGEDVDICLFKSERLIDNEIEEVMNSTAIYP